MTIPAPLTDEQIEAMADTFCYSYLLTLSGYPEHQAAGAALFKTWLAAVIAKAKREAAEEIAQAIEADADDEDDEDDGYAVAHMSAYDDGLTEAAAIARRIGGDHA